MKNKALKFGNLLVLLLATIVFVSCSGMVQTNPIPDPKKYSLPNISEMELSLLKVDEKYIKDYDDYAREFFKVHLVDVRKSIWSIGLERGHYDQDDNY